MENNKRFTHASLFSGIGGFDLAAEWMGWENKLHCEINPFCQRILKHYWPNADSYTDIQATDFSGYNGKIDILTGGFPCQPFSHAGKRLGTEDDRHLWPHMLRAIGEIQPRWVVGENVRGLVSWDGGLVFDQVQIDLEAKGYEVIPFLLPACSVDAPHRRDRIWFIAHANSFRNTRHGNELGESEKSGQRRTTHAQTGHGITTDTLRSGQPGQGRTLESSDKEKAGDRQEHRALHDGGWITQSPVCARNDELSARLDGITLREWRKESTKGAGNAIVPKLVYQIFKAVEACEAIKD